MRNSANVDDFLDQLKICENKLQKLMTQANVRDSASFRKIMNSTEVGDTKIIMKMKMMMMRRRKGEEKERGRW